jgi:hypothetical protein
MATELNVLPVSIVAGESTTAALTGVSATGRTCVYQFQAVSPFSVACDISGDEFSITLSASNTLALKAGSVRFVALATTTATGAVECVDTGYIYVYNSPLATSDYAAALAAIEAAILSYATTPNKRVTIGTMSVEYRSLNDLISLKSYYQSEIAREISGTGSGPFRIKSRFNF